VAGRLAGHGHSWGCQAHQQVNNLYSQLK
jgi:hypothetical protein